VQSIRREVDLAWLAGIIDGEGCLSVDLKKADNGKSYLMPKVRIINTDVRMIQKCARIYVELGVVFYYNINKKRRDHWLDQTAIIISSQGSSVKVLKAIMPHLANKQEIAGVMLSIIEYVQRFPKGGNTVAHDYTTDATFHNLMQRWKDVRAFHIDPSTTTRRAGDILAW
jgi:hypothetical protein